MHCGSCLAVCKTVNQYSLGKEPFSLPVKGCFTHSVTDLLSCEPPRDRDVILLLLVFFVMLGSEKGTLRGEARCLSCEIQ